jgi:DNA polymerase elongation subunit (family B)
VGEMKTATQEAAEPREPKILLWDIETAPLKNWCWGIWEQNISVNMIEKDWHLLSWAAKWLGDPKTKVFYMDQRKAKNIEDDREILKGLWKLLDQADCVITQNGKAFDAKKVNARLAIHGIPPPSPYKHIDTKQLAKKNFAFTSTRMEYLSTVLCPEETKSKHKKFPGFELWDQCIKGNSEAWEEMKKYNIQDVITLEKVYKRLAAYGVGVDLNVFHSDSAYRCHCGSSDFTKKGFAFTASGKFQRYKCAAPECGAWHQDKGAKNNLFSEIKKASLKKPRGT